MKCDPAELIRLRQTCRHYEKAIQRLSDELYRTKGAMKTLDSEREANEILTDTVEYLSMVIRLLVGPK